MAEYGASSLRGMRILIVEDEYYLADDLARTLERAGAAVAGPVGSLDEARAIVDAEKTRLDCAILDINLKGEMAFPIADRLQAEEIPFVIASGYSGGALPDRFKSAPRLEKPFDPAQIAEAISRLLRPTLSTPPA